MLLSSVHQQNRYTVAYLAIDKKQKGGPKATFSVETS
jgi:hypothetical protein